MAVKGAMAKQRVVDIISNAFGENFQDKNIYVHNFIFYIL